MAKNLLSHLAYAFCLLILTASANAQTVPLWGRWEQTFKASTTAEPETEITVGLTSPSGKRFTVAGFWDGGETWRVRFMPAEAGKWVYRTHSVPVVAGLNGKSGDFVCRREAGNTRFLQHGAVVLQRGADDGERIDARVEQ